MPLRTPDPWRRSPRTPGAPRGTRTSAAAPPPGSCRSSLPRRRRSGSPPCPPAPPTAPPPPHGSRAARTPLDTPDTSPPPQSPSRLCSFPSPAGGSSQCPPRGPGPTPGGSRVAILRLMPGGAPDHLANVSRSSPTRPLLSTSSGSSRVAGCCSGLASTTSRSASKPGRTWPIRVSSFSSSALTVVAACSAASGVKPVCDQLQHFASDPRHAGGAVARIRPGDHLDPGRPGPADGVHEDWLQHLAAALEPLIVVVPAWLGQVVHDVGGRVEERAPLRHELQRFVRKVGAVLDATDTGLHRRQRPLRPVGMSQNSGPPGVGLGHDRRELGLAVDLFPWIGVGGAGSLGSEHLDPIDRMLEVHPNESPERLGRREPRTEQVGEVRRVEPRRRVRSRPHVIPRGLHIRAGERAALDQLAQADIREMRDAGTPHRGHPAFEGRAHRLLARDVHVRIDQSRHDVSAGEVDAAYGWAGWRGRTDRFDAAGAGHHRLTRAHLAVGNVDD